MKTEKWIDITYRKAWHVRVKALRIIYSRKRESFADLRRFMSVLQASNLVTAADFASDYVTIGVEHFCRVFWAFGALIANFHNCRSIISIGKYQESLLIATSCDAINGIFPLAFAIVKKERINAWAWFLD